ncbi:MAG: hydrogenase nickel incorporation protein HypB [Pseudomonadota bacterium]
MCGICGCSGDSRGTVTNLQTGDSVVMAHDEHDHQHAHSHDHTHGHDHVHDHEHGNDSTVSLEADILAKNNKLAERNRGWFAGRNILALNLVSSPGAGKTTLLERTIRDLSDQYPISVVEGDQETVNDAERIRSTGCDVVQINTGTGCHLEADMIARGLEQLKPPLDSIVMIENVGNLVCPAMFDLGEKCKIAILSVTEGEDKPLKYPHMFSASDVMILNKVDLLPYLQFDVEKCIAAAREVNPNILIFQVSATTGEGLENWYDWLSAQMPSDLAAEARV